jgi:hypothetical protein
MAEVTVAASRDSSACRCARRTEGRRSRRYCDTSRPCWPCPSITANSHDGLLGAAGGTGSGADVAGPGDASPAWAAAGAAAAEEEVEEGLRASRGEWTGDGPLGEVGVVSA